MPLKIRLPGYLENPASAMRNRDTLRGFFGQQSLVALRILVTDATIVAILSDIFEAGLSRLSSLEVLMHFLSLFLATCQVN